MRRVFLFTLFILLLPSADMVSTDSFVEWVEINPNHTNSDSTLIHYPNGNLVKYLHGSSVFFNSTLIYDASKVLSNYYYHKINETLGIYIDLAVTFDQVFYNPIKNDTYGVTSHFSVWKYNDTYFFNQTDLGFEEGYGMIWYNFTSLGPFYGPSSLRNTKMVYDYQNNFIMLYGGASSLADTWIFDIDSKKWIQMTPLNQPGFRRHHAMTYNEYDGKIYLFGGSDGSILYNDLWVYDYITNTWAEIITSNTIEPRSSHGMIYDSHNNKLLVYQGGNRDLWAYDFKSKYWTFLSSSGPSPADYEQLKDWIMYGNSSILYTNYNFYILIVEMNSPPPGTEIIVTHTETVTTASTSTETDYTTVTDKTTETNFEDITRYQNLTTLLDGTIEETPFYTLGVFSVILATIVIQRKRRKRSHF